MATKITKKNLKWSKIDRIILGSQRLLHGSGLNLGQTEIIITPCHAGATMDLGPTWCNRRNRFITTSVSNLYASLNS
jgi:hypothetical protein